MDKELYFDILKNNIKQSAPKLSLGNHWMFQKNYNTKHTAQIIT